MTIKTNTFAPIKSDGRIPADMSLFRLLSRSEARRARAIAYKAALAVIG